MGWRGARDRSRQFRDHRTHEVLVRIAHHPGDAGEASNLLRRTLGVTARNQNATLRITPMDAADELANFRISGSRNGARVQDRDLALLEARDLLEPCLKQLLFYGGTIGLAGPTAEIEDVKCIHAQKRIVSQEFAGRQPSGAQRTPLI